ncbi:ABC transporter ATP-binding protein [Lapidilactobacillus bayanensis]|uniref:ABC transporter ATP-binding protein n=1 Tax=Lapidilactobacillus bayanensis TaxID=2485998 RepID=UPI000F767469|nr:ABC transporter ATP-binding protein [Lapidilactobacillus bayanensis]
MLSLQHLSKSFGTMKAVDDVDFELHHGEILGLIGQNGAGKTTTFRMILNFIEPDQGTISWNDAPFTQSKYDQLGYLPEERGLFPKMTVENQIIYFAELRGMKRAEIRQEIPKWLSRFEVKAKATDKIKDLSKGNAQKVQLIATLIHHPKLVILDEPFSGLDPVNVSLLRDGIMDLKKQGAAIIYSDHNMDNVEQVSDQLVMLRSGKMVLHGPVAEVRQSFGRIKLYLESALTKEQLLAVPGVIAVAQQQRHFEITLADEAVGRRIFDLATANGYIPEFNQQPPTLEEIFKLKAGEPNA